MSQHSSASFKKWPPPSFTFLLAFDTKSYSQTAAVTVEFCSTMQLASTVRDLNLSQATSYQTLLSCLTE